MDARFLPDDSENNEYLRQTIPAISPAHSPTDNPSRCYRINTDYIGFLLSGIDVYVHDDAFIGDEATRLQAARWFTELQCILMTGNLLCGENDTMQLRQNPSNPCQLEQSFDNGASWSLAFDYALCLSAAQSNDLLATSSAVANAIAVAELHASIYTGDYQDIAPGMNYDSGSSDAFRDQAYCYAVQLLLLYLGTALTEMQADGWSGWDVVDIVAEVTKYGSALLLGATGAGLIAISPTVYFATTVVGIAATAVDDLIDMYEPNSGTDWFILPETQSDLLCCGSSALSGMTPDFARFSNMFDSCDTPVVDAFLRAFLDTVLSSQKTYIAFLGLIEEAFQALESGQVFNCPCDVETITFEFTTESGIDPDTYYGLSGWEVIPSNAGCLNYIPESGCHHGDETTGDYTNFRAVAIYRSGISGEIQSVEIQGTQALGLQAGEGAAANITYGGDGQGWDNATAMPGGDAKYKRIAYRELSSESLFVSLISDVRRGYDDAFLGSCKLERVIIKGRNLSVS